MQICHDHNMTRSAGEKRFGIRLSLPPGDTLANLLGQGWEALHWYRTEKEREIALDRIRGKHSYSRPGDYPTYVCTRIVRD